MALNTGTYISGIAHGVFILWALFGGIFLRSDEPTPADVSDVSLISGAEFAAMTLPDQAPDVPSAEPVVVPPTPEDTAPELASGADDAPDQSGPEDVTPPVAEALPETPEPVVVPPADVPDDAPVLDAPPSASIQVPVETVTDEVPKPVEAPRISDLAAPEAPPGAEVAETATPEASPDSAAETVADEKPATAPEQAATEIVTEAEKPASSVMASSRRPVSRPPRPTPSPAPKPDTPADPTKGINDALAGLADEPAQPAADIPTGPPMTGSEKDGFRIAVSNCWVVDVGSQAANVVVTVAFSLDQDGKVIGGSLKMIRAEGGDDNAVSSAFGAARRAVLRCQNAGYDLPREKYAQWRDVELTFNPKDMRIK